MGYLEQLKNLQDVETGTYRTYTRVPQGGDDNISHRQETAPERRPYTPRHQGGLRRVDTSRPCKACGGVEWQYHVTYRYCSSCGREDGPGAVQEDRP